ncbi:MAG: MBL fold metallo-hydrolase, partial [Oscillospiraceae bacterium]|nr:MBL fold metallo-hydrolase [Oscillospiraceae bacterium]
MTAPQNPKANGAGAKRPPQIKKALPTVVLVAILFVLGSLPGWMGRSGWMDILRPAEAAAASAEGSLRIHVIDVGQGDSILIDAQGEFMLIDGGERGQEDTVVQYLRDQGVEELRYVVATHPHTDHIGGLAYGVLAAFPVGTVIAPRFSPENTPTTQTYEKFLDAVTGLAANGTAAKYARPGDVYPLGEASFTILGPLKEDGRNYNNDSVILRVEYQSRAALFMGDAEKP